ncbi:unnamed protein product [Polarella glacialis]|uniref:Uncharacterized protein n=1 Tax=Polarella glacialis TaxID=89957 RepID=A0A813M5Q7_POLGL|nr:unnamed protein product [Polarella glacialis]
MPGRLLGRWRHPRRLFGRAASAPRSYYCTVFSSESIGAVGSSSRFGGVDLERGRLAWLGEWRVEEAADNLDPQNPSLQSNAQQADEPEMQHPGETSVEPVHVRTASTRAVSDFYDTMLQLLRASVGLRSSPEALQLGHLGMAPHEFDMSEAMWAK